MKKIEAKLNAAKAAVKAYNEAEKECRSYKIITDSTNEILWQTHSEWKIRYCAMVKAENAMKRTIRAAAKEMGLEIKKFEYANLVEKWVEALGMLNSRFVAAKMALTNVESWQAEYIKVAE